MSNDAFVAFWVGCLTRLILGIVIAAVMSAISNNIEKGDKRP